MRRLEWETAYTVKRRWESIGILNFGRYVCDIWFEDAPLFKNLSRDNAEFLAAALNGAWNLGRNAGAMEAVQ